jgi:proteasome alpha subunit
MQQTQHQLMGYDRAITMFSPDGRLLQVEYAKKTVKQGSTAIGITCKDGVVLVTDKRILDTLIISETVDKIFQIDDHIISTASGIIPDARVLVERAQTRAQQHTVTFDSPVDIISIVKDICSLMQVTTQGGGYRPFGVSMLIAGVDKDGVKLYSTDPVGVYNQYRAAAIGEKGDEASDVLREKWKEGMTIQEGVKLAITVLKQVLNGDISVDRVDCAYVKDGKTTKLASKEVEALLK